MTEFEAGLQKVHTLHHHFPMEQFGVAVGVAGRWARVDAEWHKRSRTAMGQQQSHRQNLHVWQCAREACLGSGLCMSRARCLCQPLVDAFPKRAACHSKLALRSNRSMKTCGRAFPAASDPELPDTSIGHATSPPQSLHGQTVTATE